MFLHSEKKIFVILLVSFVAMFAALSFLITDDLKIPQKQTVMAINIKNQVNICLPDDEFDEKNF